MRKQLFCIVALLIICCLSVSAQSAKPESSTSDSLFTFKKLPPLNDFIESALVNSPILKSSDLQIEEMFEKIKKEKKSWTDFVFIDANAKYGLFNQLSITQQSSGTDLSVKDAREQFNYYAGLTIRLPISNFITKKNEINILNKNLSESKARREQIKLEITQLVIDEYYKLKNLSQSMLYNQEIVQAMDVNYVKAKKDISIGTINMFDFNGALIAKQKALDTYSKVENEFYAQFFKIQVLTGLKLKK